MRNVDGVAKLKSERAVSLMRRFALLFLVFAVFSLGLEARLALYTTSPNISVSSAKVATEKRSAQILRSLEVREYKQHPSDKLVSAFLLRSIQKAPDLSIIVDETDIGLYESSRTYLSSIPSLRRPPPSIV